MRRPKAQPKKVENKTRPRPTKKRDVRSEQNEPSCSTEATENNTIPDPDSFNGAELSMTQLYDIVRNLSSKVFENQQSVFENKLSTMQTELDQLKKTIKRQDRCIEKLQWEKEIKDKQIQELNTKLDQIEQQQYDRDIKMIGFPDQNCDEDEEKKNLVKFAKDTLDMKLKLTDIVQLQRLGKSTEMKPNRRLVVRFKKLSTRKDFYQRRKKTFVNSDPKKNVYINDRVTTHRSNLLYAARQLVKKSRIHSSWIQYGNVMIRKSEHDRPIEIKSHDDLTEFRETNDWMDDVTIADADTSDLPDTSDEEDD